MSQGGGGITKQGWLQKQADWRWTWQPRLFSLKGRLMAYKEREGEPDKKCARIISIMQDTPATGGGGSAGTSSSSPSSATFQLRMDSGEAWILKAENQEEASAWISLIQEALWLENDGKGNTASGRSSGGVRPQAVLVATLQKRGLWTYQWNPRTVAICGVNFSYSKTPEDPPRGMYTLQSWDRCGPAPLLSGEGVSNNITTNSSGDGSIQHLRAVSTTDPKSKMKARTTAKTSASDDKEEEEEEAIEMKDNLQEDEEGVATSWSTTTAGGESHEALPSAVLAQKSKEQESEQSTTKKRYSHEDVAVRTTNGEMFLLRFDDVDLLDKWTRKIRTSLRIHMSNEWTRVLVGASSPGGGGSTSGVTSLFTGSSTSNKASQLSSSIQRLVCTHHHCSALINGDQLLVMMGIPCVPKKVVNKGGGAAGMLKAYLPAQKSPVPTNELLCINLTGEHQSTLVEVQAFSEGPHMKVRPMPRTHAGSCVLNGSLFIHGGRRSFGHGETTTHNDLWRLSLENPKELAWLRLSSDRIESVVPTRSSHSFTAIPSSGASGRGGSVLVAGGFPDRAPQATDTVYLYTPSSHTAIEVQPLPEPRAGHAACWIPSGVVVGDGALQNTGQRQEEHSPTERSEAAENRCGSEVAGRQGTPGEKVVVIGGHVCADPLDPKPLPPSCALLQYHMQEDRWSPIPCFGKPISELPSLVEPMVASSITPSKTEIFLLAGSNVDEIPRLFSLLDLRDAKSGGGLEFLITEIDGLGAVPRGFGGLSMHVVKDYLYVIGELSGTDEELRSGVVRTLIPSYQETKRRRDLFLLSRTY